LAAAEAKLTQDQALFNYSKITAPFDGTVTQRYANFGTLMQSGTSSTDALPLVQLSQDSVFRLVIPVAESYVSYIKIGDPVDVNLPSLNRTVEGRVVRVSLDVKGDTRTLHTEVDVPNTDRTLMTGLFAKATLMLDRKEQAVAVPLEAVNIEGEKRTVWAIEPSNKVELRQVTIGIETPSDVEVVSGLKEGELVVVGDRSSLRPGETVCPKDAQLIQYKPED
jgi:RND family efflux transporter MFP subunit